MKVEFVHKPTEGGTKPGQCYFVSLRFGLWRVGIGWLVPLSGNQHSWWHLQRYAYAGPVETPRVKSLIVRLLWVAIQVGKYRKEHAQ